VERFWRSVPQIATVGLVGGFRDDGGIGTQEEPAVFRRNTRALRVLRDSGLVKRKGRSLPHLLLTHDTRRTAQGKLSSDLIQRRPRWVFWLCLEFCSAAIPKGRRIQLSQRGAEALGRGRHTLSPQWGWARSD